MYPPSCFFKIAKKGTLEFWEEFYLVSVVAWMHTANGNVIKSATSDADVTVFVHGKDLAGSFHG